MTKHSIHGFISIAIVFLAFPALFRALEVSCDAREQAKKEVGLADGRGSALARHPALPPIDRAASKVTQEVTFAMG